VHVPFGGAGVEAPPKFVRPRCRVVLRKNCEKLKGMALGSVCGGAHSNLAAFWADRYDCMGFSEGDPAAMFIRHFASLLAIFAYASAASANSCSNVDIHGSFDESGLQESEYGIYAAGTFRIQGEEDESKQPMFNLTQVDCEKKLDDVGRASVECKFTQAVVWATSGNPDTEKPNCSLDLETSTYTMKELQKGSLVGMGSSGACYNTILTIDRNAKRVYLSFTRSKEADNIDKIKSGTCGMPPRTQVLMNCTGWARIRKHGQAPPRYCDFSSSSDK
jgi:hypothetical protein